MGPRVIEVPERFNAAAFFVDRHLAEGRGARTAFRYRSRRVTYAGLAERVNRCGNALLDQPTACSISCGRPFGGEGTRVHGRLRGQSEDSARDGEHPGMISSGIDPTRLYREPVYSSPRGITRPRLAQPVCSDLRG